VRASLLQLADYSISEKRLFVHALKGSVSDEFWLTEMEAEALDAWLAVRGLKPGPLFTSRKQGGAIKRGQIFRLMRKYCAAAGIPIAKAHPHALRHSCGTHVLRMVKDMPAVQQWLRHRDLRSTQIYAKFTRKEEVAEQLRGWGKK
jgi:type 1 fimbriae regulatory protein FimB